MSNRHDSYGPGPILTFRFGSEGLAAREARLERVPPRDAVLAPLPAQIRNLVPDPRGEVDEAAVQVLDLDTEGVDLIEMRLHGLLQVELFRERLRVRIAVLRRRGDEAFAPVRLGVIDEVPQLPQSGKHRIEPPEELLEGRDEGVRLFLIEQAHGRVRMHAEVGGSTHRNPRSLSSLPKDITLCPTSGGGLPGPHGPRPPCSPASLGPLRRCGS